MSSLMVVRLFLGVENFFTKPSELIEMISLKLGVEAPLTEFLLLLLHSDESFAKFVAIGGDQLQLLTQRSHLLWGVCSSPACIGGICLDV